MEVTDRNEIITLSSDEESDCANKSKSEVRGPLNSQQVNELFRSVDLHPNFSLQISKLSSKKLKDNIQKQYHKVIVRAKIKNKLNDKVPKDQTVNNNSLTNPVVVDLEDCNDISSEKTDTNCQSEASDEDTSNKVEDHSYSHREKIEKNETNHKKDEFTEEDEHAAMGHNKENLPEIINKTNSERVDVSIESNSNNSNESQKTGTSENIKGLSDSQNKVAEEGSSGLSNECPEFFKEFVEFCGSLENIKEDRVRLKNKLLKRCEDANPNYVRSQGFRTLVEKGRGRLTKSNLYLIAKEVADELSTRKKIASWKPSSEGERHQADGKSSENNEKMKVNTDGRSKKHTKIINKIIKRLDKLGARIRELEEAEVDLSDEEESSYVQLQRYRERFCQIHKKLCEYTKEASDANRVYSRKICFSGSKYPAINKCIEKWLNKTKRFPDFTDIMKLLESQSSSLGLPSDHESIRTIAIEIFQQVGVMLQRRRKYDLWDSFCGFINDEEDPAINDPQLEKVLKGNFETRVKKEQEIFKYYTEKQEKDRLEPEEIPEEEANDSPVESGNEDEKEIEDIEKSINERLDVVMEEEQRLDDVKENGENTTKENGGENSSEKESEHPADSNEIAQDDNKDSTPVKESKNNYKNCKSLKWRCENKKSSDETASNTINLEDSSESEEKESDDANEGNNDMEVISEESEDSKEEVKVMDVEEVEKEDSDLECVCVGSTQTKEKDVQITEFRFSKFPKVEGKSILKSEKEDSNTVKSPGSGNRYQKMCKREYKSENESPECRKKRCLSTLDAAEEKFNSQVVEIDVENENVKKGATEIFEVYRCQIEQNLEKVYDKFDFQEDFSEKRKDWVRGKTFRDLTNISRLMELHGRKRKLVGLFSQSLYHRGFHEFDKPSWKKKYKVNYRYTDGKDQKCALNHEEKTVENFSGENRSSEEKEIQNNPESGGGEGSNFCSGNGSGSEDDKNDDENKKNEKVDDDDLDEKKSEEDDEEKDEENEEGEDRDKGERESVIHSNDTSQESGNVSLENVKENNNDDSGDDVNEFESDSKEEEDSRIRASVEEDEVTPEESEQVDESGCEDSFGDMAPAVDDETEDKVQDGNTFERNCMHESEYTEGVEEEKSPKEDVERLVEESQSGGDVNENDTVENDIEEDADLRQVTTERGRRGLDNVEESNEKEFDEKVNEINTEREEESLQREDEREERNENFEEGNFRSVENCDKEESMESREENDEKEERRRETSDKSEKEESDEWGENYEKDESNDRTDISFGSEDDSNETTKKTDEKEERRECETESQTNKWRIDYCGDEESNERIGKVCVEESNDREGGNSEGEEESHEGREVNFEKENDNESREDLENEVESNTGREENSETKDESNEGRETDYETEEENCERENEITERSEGSFEKEESRERSLVGYNREDESNDGSEVDHKKENEERVEERSRLGYEKDEEVADKREGCTDRRNTCEKEEENYEEMEESYVKESEINEKLKETDEDERKVNESNEENCKLEDESKEKSEEVSKLGEESKKIEEASCENEEINKNGEINYEKQEESTGRKEEFHTHLESIYIKKEIYEEEESGDSGAQNEAIHSKNLEDMNDNLHKPNTVKDVIIKKEKIESTIDEAGKRKRKKSGQKRNKIDPEDDIPLNRLKKDVKVEVKQEGMPYHRLKNDTRIEIKQESAPFNRLKKETKIDVRKEVKSLPEIPRVRRYNRTMPERQPPKSYGLLREANTQKENTNSRLNNTGASNAQAEKDSYVDYIVQKIRKRNNSNASTASDEERVKKFLLHSPSSISITPPKKISMSKPPSQAALQALATLRGLKGISTTRVKSRPKSEEDVVVIGESYTRKTSAQETIEPKRRRNDLPVISNVQSIKSTTPKIVTVQGNVPNFGTVDNPWYNRVNNGQQAQSSTSLRISNVWGGLPNNFIQTMQSNESMTPSCSFRQSNPNVSTVGKKKNQKKNVEYVVLE